MQTTNPIQSNNFNSGSPKKQNNNMSHCLRSTSNELLLQKTYYYIISTTHTGQQQMGPNITQQWYQKHIVIEEEWGQGSLTFKRGRPPNKTLVVEECRPFVGTIKSFFIPYATQLGCFPLLLYFDMLLAVHDLLSFFFNCKQQHGRCFELSFPWRATFLRLDCSSTRSIRTGTVNGGGA